MAERRPGDVYPRCGTSPGEGGRTSSVIRKTDPWRGLCINHYIRWVGIVIPGGGVSFPLGEGPLRLRRQCVQSLGEALGYGGGGALWEAHHSVRGVTRILAWRVPVHRGARPFSFPSGRVLGEDTAVGWEVQWGWREGVGGWQGRRRGEAARGGVLSLEREARTRESRVAWRVHRGARPLLLSVRSSPWRGHSGWLGGAVVKARIVGVRGWEGGGARCCVTHVEGHRPYL